MTNTTGIFTGWVLVYKDGKVMLKQYNENQQTSCIHNIETFETEQELDARIIELGLEDINIDNIL